MEQASVASFKKDDSFEGFLLVRNAEMRSSSKGSGYLDMMVGDRTGEINGKMWDGTVTAPAPGSVVKIRATVTEYNGRLQLRVTKIREAAENDEFDMSALIPCAPRKPREMYGDIQKAVEDMTNPVLKKLTQKMLELAGDKLMYFPAAKSMHHAERAGLLHHTTSMLKTAQKVWENYDWLDRDLLMAGVIVHDLSKITEMKADDIGNVSDYSTEGMLLGHLVRGVTRVQEAAQLAGIDVNEEYVLLLEHMVISHHGEPEFGSPRPPMFPEAEMLHWIDLLDARMNEMEAAVIRTPSGAFSDKIWALDRRIYHPRYFSETEAVQSDSDAAYQGRL